MMGIGIMGMRNGNRNLDRNLDRNGKRGTGNGYFLLTTMTEACDKMHFTLFGGQSKTVSKI